MQVHAVMVETQNTSIGQVIDQQSGSICRKARNVTDLIYLVDRSRAPSRWSGSERQRAPRIRRAAYKGSADARRWNSREWQA